MRPDRSSVSSLSRAAAHRALPLAFLLVGTTSLFAADTLRALPPVPPAEERLESPSDATLVPTTDFHVTAPRIG